MKRIKPIALTVLAAVAPGIAHTSEIGHFNGGLANIRDYLVPDPGFYTLVYNYFYTTDQINDRNGDEINSVTISPGGGPGVTLGVDVNLDMYALVPAFAYVTEVKSIGLRIGALVAPSFANASFGASYPGQPDAVEARRIRTSTWATCTSSPSGWATRSSIGTSPWRTAFTRPLASMRLNP